MSLNKVKGNMYIWCTHTHCHLGGRCPHECAYCYVHKGRNDSIPKYQGELHLIEKELNVNYGSDKTIFIEHMNDIFAEKVKDEWIMRILNHCRDYPNNKYILQTKNPAKIISYIEFLPRKFILGTTIESNRFYKNTKAPLPEKRYEAIIYMPRQKFVTIEPIMDFDVTVLARWIIDIRPEFVNIGADSKHCDLPEPPKHKILELIEILKDNNIVVHKKNNLERLLA